MTNTYYKTGDHLRAKHQLAGDKFVRWSLDLIPDWQNATILDAGGGWGRYIWHLIDHYGVQPQNITLTDFSVGMLVSAGEEATQRGVTVDMAACSIEALPFKAAHFDLVMANKVLYHLEDIPRGAHELARVLKPGGRLLANTNSEKIPVTIIDLHYQAMDIAGIPYEPEPPSPFSMENGGELLAPAFQNVETYYYRDEDLYHSAAEMRATYETIGRYRNLLARDDRAKDLPRTVEELVQDVIDREGVLRSPSLMGAFVCTR